MKRVGSIINYGSGFYSIVNIFLELFFIFSPTFPVFWRVMFLAFTYLPLEMLIDKAYEEMWSNEFVVEQFLGTAAVQ